MSFSSAESVSVAQRGVAAFLYGFAGAFVIAVAVLLALRFSALPPTMLIDAGQRWVMDLLPSDEIAALKVRHAEISPAAGIGLFGNSRILMVGQDDLGLHGRTFFNFAVPGTSFRQSVALLEELAARDRLPGIAVISMDHAELGLQGGAAVYPGPPRRWLREWSDLAAIGAANGLRAALVHALNFLAAESLEWAMTFNHNYIAAKTRALLGIRRPDSAHRADGSRREERPAAPVAIGAMPRRADTYPELEGDFERLRAIRDSGARIVIYESPIAPHLAKAPLSAIAQDVRSRFLEACARLRFECHEPPLLEQRPWFDRDHAPSASLGEWLRSIVAAQR